MKKSHQVLLAITGSVVLTGCDRASSPSTGSAEGSTNAVASTNRSHVGRGFYPWYHLGRYFSSSGARADDGASRPGSPTRSGFGQHGSSATS